jgi:hypothetical protein
MASIHEVTRHKMTRECRAARGAGIGQAIWPRRFDRPARSGETARESLATSRTESRRRLACRSTGGVHFRFDWGAGRQPKGAWCSPFWLRPLNIMPGSRSPDPASLCSIPRGSSCATRHRHEPPSCCTCARAMLAKPRFWGCRADRTGQKSKSHLNSKGLDR